jgi:hypothetical protein
MWLRYPQLFLMRAETITQISLCSYFYSLQRTDKF